MSNDVLNAVQFVIDGQSVLVDRDDAHLVEAHLDPPHRWRVDKKGYVRRQVSWRPTRWVFLHAEILECPPGMQVDHIDRNTLDNCRANLRAATNQQNGANKPGMRGTSPFKGVCWCRRKRFWRAQITIRKRQKFLGHFATDREAAAAYDVAAREAFGEFAYLNGVDVEQERLTQEEGVR
jgi:hypothetical protein